MSNSKNTKKSPTRKADKRDQGAKTLPLPKPKTSKTAPKKATPKSGTQKSALAKKRSEASRKAWVTRKANAKKTTTVKKAK